MQSNFRVQVSKDYLVFASAHFITFRGHQCETLHGHNYRVGVAVEGTVDSECLFVLDFSVLKQIVRRAGIPPIPRIPQLRVQCNQGVSPGRRPCPTRGPNLCCPARYRVRFRLAQLAGDVGVSG